MKTIRARIHHDALQRVSQFFDATLHQALTEVLQNARRSGATKVDVEIGTGGSITITDDGDGIAEPETLLSFGESQWDEKTQDGEGAAGMGVYALARWRPTIQSRTEETEKGWAVDLKEEHFRGDEAAEVIEDEAAPKPHGTRVRMRTPADAASITRAGSQHERYSRLNAEALANVCRKAVDRVARFYPLPVRMDGAETDQVDYLAECCHIEEWEGLRIGIRNETQKYHATQETGDINFHGKTIRDKYLPSEHSRDHRCWKAKIDVGPKSRLELTLPARNKVVEGEFANRMREQARRVIFEAMATSKTVVEVDWETRAKAAAMGIELGVPAPMLRRWRPAYAHREETRTGERTKASPETTLVMTDEECASKEQTLWRALRGSEVESRLVEKDNGLTGYGWYDELTRVTKVRLEGSANGKPFSREDFEDTEDDAPEKATVMVMVLEVSGPQGDIRLPVDIALWDSEENTSWPSEAVIVVTKDCSATPNELAEMLLHGYFSPSDDSESDSYETQRDRFEEDALQAAERLVSTRKEALKSVAERIAIQALAYEVGRGESVTVKVARDQDGGTHIDVEATDDNS